ncbi:peptidase domain-containing ABC transporter [candidate division FCPU426 bacterium]|nr:peptidase domain-containing ABC transporter [candidate division FCPU426 bacterium]
MQLQMNATECGPACLAMILNYYGRVTRLGEAQERCGAGRDGIHANTLAEAARSFGLRVRAYTLEPDDLAHLNLPAVIHWKFNHFMVLERMTPGKAYLADPAKGRLTLSAREFAEGFTGVAMTFEPGDLFHTRPGKGESAWLKLLFGILRIPGSQGAMLQIFGASLFLQVIGLALPLATKILVDQVLAYQLRDFMGLMALGIFMLAASYLLIGYLRSALFLFLQGRVDAQLMVGFFEHVLALPFQFFQKRKSGDLLMRLGSNVMLREILTSQTIAVGLDGGLVVVYLLVLLSQSRPFAFMALGIGLVQVLILLLTTQRLHALTQQELAAGAESQSYLLESLKGMATLKASGSEERALDAWSNRFYSHLNLSLKRDHFSAVVQAGLSGLQMLSPLALLWLGGLMVLENRLTLGTMLALQALGMAFLSPLSSLVGIGRQWQLVGAHWERLTDIIEAKPEQAYPEFQQAPRLSGRVQCRNVNFRYDPQGAWVLQDISLEICPGQKVALVGRSGAGKTTLAMLLLGLYQPVAGEILFDGISLRQLNLRSVRSQFGAVLQESFLFTGSIRQNIAFHQPALNLEQVERAARLAAIHDEIKALPMGYETLLTEGGGGLSGGQRQRLSIARALAAGPSILLLDEATSHLDTLTEAEVDRNLSREKCTRIIVAHRLSTICNADLIAVLDQGRIVEKGTHARLSAQGGIYAALVRNQTDAPAISTDA